MHTNDFEEKSYKCYNSKIVFPISFCLFVVFCLISINSYKSYIYKSIKAAFLFYLLFPYRLDNNIIKLKINNHMLCHNIKHKVKQYTI